MKLNTAKLGEAYTRWQPYAMVVALSGVALTYPTTAFVILAVLHWTALDAIRTRQPLQIDLGIATQAASVERKHKLCGDVVTVTNSQIYRVGNRHYLVQVSRASHDLQGNELA